MRQDEALRFRSEELGRVAALAQADAVSAPRPMVVVVVGLAPDKAVLGVEATAKAAAARTRTAQPRVEVELAYDGGEVAHGTQRLGQQRRVLADDGAAVRRSNAQLPAVPARQEGRTSRSAPGGRPKVGEVDRLRRQLVRRVVGFPAKFLEKKNVKVKDLEYAVDKLASLAMSRGVCYYIKALTNYILANAESK